MHMHRQLASYPGAAILVAIAVAGCASTAMDPKPSEPVYTDCVFGRTVNEWNALDDRHLIIYGMTEREAYLARLSFPNPDVMFNLGVAVVDADYSGSICGGSTDGLFFGPRSAVPGKNLIVSLQKIDKEQARRLLSLVKDKDALQRELAITAGSPAPAPAK
jgi:hypothetical protein